MAMSSRSSVFLCFTALCCWNLIVSIDATALSVVLPTIAGQFEASNTQIYWTGTAFVLCDAVFQPAFASLSSLSRKAAIFTALTLFTTGAIICSVAQNIATLIAGRCVQGAGGGGLLVLTYVVMADLFSLQERSKLTGFISLTWLVGTTCGPVLGGGFTQSATWRWIFWFNLPFCAICYVLVALFMHVDTKDNHSKLSGVKNVDWLGNVMFTGSMTAFLLAISWGGVMFAWSSWRTIVPLVLGLTGLVGWSVYSYGFSSNPMIPLVVINDRTAAISYFATIVHGIIQFGLLYYLPLYYQAAKAYSPVISGVGLIPHVLASAPSTAIAGILIAKTRSIKPYALVGWLSATYGLALFNVLDVGTTVFGWITINVPPGIGLGILFAALAMATQASAEHRADCSDVERTRIKAMAAGLNSFFRALGQAFGIAVGQAAFTNQMSRDLGSEIGADAAALVQEFRSGHLDGSQRTTWLAAYVSSLRVVWWILFGLAALVSILMLFTADVGLHGNASSGAENSEGRKESTSTTGTSIVEPKGVAKVEVSEV